MLVKTLLVLLRICLCIGMLLFVVLRILLGLWMLLFVALCLLVSLLRIHVLPGIRAVVVLLPAGPAVLVDVSIMPCVHVATGCFTNGGITEGG